MKKLFLLDGMALIYRAHFALSKTPRFTSGGLNTSAIMVFTNTLLDVLKKEKPTHMAVVFDTEAPTERHLDFADLKMRNSELRHHSIGRHRDGFLLHIGQKSKTE